jgi:hypothetical protein
MRYITPAVLVLVGLIHVLPLAGVLGSARLASLYGIVISEPNLEILMRHRAALFGLLGVFLLYAAFQRHLQPLALGAAFVSVASFLALAWSIGGYNQLLSRVVLIDILALVLILIGSVVYVLHPGKA